ncbi:LrgB family protein [Novosphingobium humi]|uniref:LrgB family protein n=1 Tax=Novosphingobium humi TaxID=2282397 RepID=A0ABY7U2Y6_9SPHN|nr:LrgB family protein [Novosphingobium humi]WCT79151.1 LrgB family protein [Novosphingobium humi]
MTDLHEIWGRLNANPLLHLTITLVAFRMGDWLYQRSGKNPLVNPVLVAVALIIAVLTATGTSYATYFAGAQFLHFLLGPATVALAIPLYRHFDHVRRSALAIFVSLLVGATTAATTAVAFAWTLGAGHLSVISMAPKSVTAPVAMTIVRQLGGLPSLTAVLVILTGVVGAMLGPLVLNALGIKDWAARGFALGVASHGIGTARALQVNEEAGAFSGLAMGLNAIATAILLPVLWQLIFG